MIFEGKNSIWIGGRAELVDPSDRDLAWAERSITFNPSLKWVLGKYVEADTANTNMQKWNLHNLKLGQPTIQHAPMNMLHQPRRIVGHFADTELLYPETADAGNPFIEALGVFYRYYFPEEMEIIERAHAEGNLFFSMECVGRSITCDSCGNEYDYKGPQDPSYCSHVNNREAARSFNDPVFLAGALIVPPVKPGWKAAHVSDIADLFRTNAKECEMAYEGVKADMPDQSPQVWEALMAQIVQLGEAEVSKVLSTKARSNLKKSQFVFPAKAPGPGSYPIPDINHARNALARSAGKPEEGAVRAAVYKKFPQLKK